MFIDDLKKDFYMRIKGQRVLLVVNYDIDAICSCKILQALFRTDHVLYTIVSVDRTDELKKSFTENYLGEKFVILINCGGSTDVVEELEPAEDVTIFILDSHRPTDVCNIYSTRQVVLLNKPAPSENIPNFEDIFKDETDDEENEDESEDLINEDSVNEESSTNKKRRINEEMILKRRDKRRWEENRDKLMFNYTQYSYYGRSSAVVLYELTWMLSNDNFDVLWCGIVGLTEQMLFNKIDEGAYLRECGELQNHVSRLSHKCQDQHEGDNYTSIKIDFDKDLKLALYRHWTVESSLLFSSFSATRLRLWTFKGEKRMHEMLAEIGIPLTQCKQKFSSMDSVYKNEFHDSIVKMSDKYGLDGIVYVSFLMQYGFRGRYSASDVVYGLFAILQSLSSDRSKTDRFLDALDALSRQRKEKLDEGIEDAKNVLVCVFKQVQSCLEMKQIQSAGPFLYLVLQHGSHDVIHCHPSGIFLFAHHALRCYVSVTKNRRVQMLPLIVSVSCTDKTGEDDCEDNCFVVAVAPVAEDSNKNFFGKAFEKAAQNSNSLIKGFYFDSSVILLAVKDRNKFFDALAVLLS